MISKILRCSHTIEADTDVADDGGNGNNLLCRTL